jgi:hypothetical protein
MAHSVLLHLWNGRAGMGSQRIFLRQRPDGLEVEHRWGGDTRSAGRKVWAPPDREMADAMIAELRARSDGWRDLTQLHAHRPADDGCE